GLPHAAVRLERRGRPDGAPREASRNPGRADARRREVLARLGRVPGRLRPGAVPADQRRGARPRRPGEDGRDPEGSGVEAMPFEPILTRNIRKPDSESIDVYLASGGYQGLRRALKELTPEKLLEEV